MKLGFKRGQKGFTLVELMVVMAILAVLASIVFPAVSGTSGVAGDSQVKQDASTVNTAVSDYFGDKTGAIVYENDTTTVVPSGNATAHAGHNVSSNQTINSRFPEVHMTDQYPNVFTSTNVTLITISATNKSTGVVSPVTPKAFVDARNAINLATLASGSYIPAIPKSYREVSDPGGFSNYLWVVKRTATVSDGGDTVDSRDVEIFKLSGVVKNGDTNYELTYEQIY